MLRSTFFFAACLAASLALTACDSGSETPQAPGDQDTSAPATTSTPATSPAGADPVAWVDGFCGAVNGFSARLNEMPQPTNGDTVGEIQRQTSELLAHFVTTLDEAIAALDALGPPPDATAETAERTTRDNYATARETAAAAKEKLDAAHHEDVDAQNHAADGLIKAQEHAHKSLDPVGELTGSPELVEAAADAPNCG
ncbi:hypothetical protein [Amycolatopsis aidingensis]|uniref:hypothetical protein n=1 Tax=Amycolatopsis aidingensis TaxID=2842453 RepID=UPI001C0CBE2F|nr:hypothetical protein [Amycolatopsis aidingensis]